MRLVYYQQVFAGHVERGVDSEGRENEREVKVQELTWLMCLSLSMIWLTTGSTPFTLTSGLVLWALMPLPTTRSV